MRIYSNKFELRTPVERRYYAAPNSIFAFAVKATLDGEDADGTITVFQGSTELTPMEATIDGYKLYQRTSGSETAVNEFDIVYTKGTVIQHFTLIENITDSTVFDIDQEGGAMELPIASDSVLGGIKVGENLTIEADGTLNVDIDVPTKTSDLENDSGFIDDSALSNYATTSEAMEYAQEAKAQANAYTDAAFANIPLATTTIAGKVIVGSGLSVDANGKIDVTGGSGGEETDPVFTAWKESNTGIQVGKNSSVTGSKGIAIGSGDTTSSSFITSASGTSSVAIGNGAQSDQTFNIAIGNSAKAQGTPAQSGLIAIGSSAKATSRNCMAIGVESIASGLDSIAIGYDTRAVGEKSLAIGSNASAQGKNSIQLGNGTNYNADTLKFRSYEILDSDGNIPEARLGSIPTVVLSGTYSDDTEFSFTVYTKQA